MTFTSKKPASEAQKLLSHEILTNMLECMNYEEVSATKNIVKVSTKQKLNNDNFLVAEDFFRIKEDLNYY